MTARLNWGQARCSQTTARPSVFPTTFGCSCVPDPKASYTHKEFAMAVCILVFVCVFVFVFVGVGVLVWVGVCA